MSAASMIPPSSKPVCSLGRSAGLDEHQEYEPKVIESVNNWAHTVKEEKNVRGSKKTSALLSDKLERTVNDVNSNHKHEAGHVVILQTDKDVNKALDVIEALPETKKDIAKAYEKVAKFELREDENWNRQC